MSRLIRSLGEILAEVLSGMPGEGREATKEDDVPRTGRENPKEDWRMPAMPAPDRDNIRVPEARSLPNFPLPAVVGCPLLPPP